MNIMLQLSPEVEAKLQSLARSSGKTIEAVAAAVLAEHASDESDESAVISLDEWNATLSELLATVPRTAATVVDTRREDIYSDDGR